MFLFCGVILSAAAAFAVYTAVSKIENLVPVVVATSNIDPRTQITSNMIKIERVPALGRNEASIDDTNLIVGGYATSKIYAGQTIIQPMVTKQFDETGVSGLALSIPAEDLRAVSFKTDASSTLNGNIKKGDFVDIIVTMSADKLGTNTSVTKTILQGVEVFDVGKQGKEDKDNKDISNISLLLTLEQIEIVKHAYAVGEVSYALNPGNAKTTPTKGIINKTFCERFKFNCTPSK